MARRRRKPPAYISARGSAGLSKHKSLENPVYDAPNNIASCVGDFEVGRSLSNANTRVEPGAGRAEGQLEVSVGQRIV